MVKTKRTNLLSKVLVVIFLLAIASGYNQCARQTTDGSCKFCNSGNAL